MGVAISGFGLIVLGLPLPQVIEPVVSSLASPLIGTGVGIFSVIWITVLQELVPSDKQGRVFSIDALGSFCLLPIGYALASILTDHISPSLVFAVGGLTRFVLATRLIEVLLRQELGVTRAKLASP
jgi:MFS family permease